MVGREEGGDGKAGHGGLLTNLGRQKIRQEQHQFSSEAPGSESRPRKSRTHSVPRAPPRMILTRSVETLPTVAQGSAETCGRVCQATNGTLTALLRRLYGLIGDLALAIVHGRPGNNQRRPRRGGRSDDRCELSYVAIGGSVILENTRNGL